MLCDREEEQDSVCDDIHGDQLHHVEGTVILHITLAVKQDQQLGREFIKYFKVVSCAVFRLCCILLGMLYC
jgi:hypothetical protein